MRRTGRLLARSAPDISGNFTEIENQCIAGDRSLERTQPNICKRPPRCMEVVYIKRRSDRLLGVALQDAEPKYT